MFFCGTISVILISIIARKIYLKKKQERSERKLKESLEKARRERRSRTRPRNLNDEQLCVVCVANPKEVPTHLFHSEESLIFYFSHFRSLCCRAVTSASVRIAQRKFSWTAPCAGHALKPKQPRLYPKRTNVKDNWLISSFSVTDCGKYSIGNSLLEYFEGE